MIDGKRGGEWCSIQDAQPRRGTREGTKGRGGERLHTVGGGYRGRKREAGAEEKEMKAQRGEKVQRGVVVWVQLLARAYIYSCYI